MPKKRGEDLHKDIRKKWKLTSIDVAVNFAITSVKSYLRDRPYIQFNEQTMIDYSCFLIRRIDRGLKILEMKDEDRIKTLGTILYGYVEADIQIEAKIQKYISRGKTAFEIGPDANQKQVNKILKKKDSTSRGMYV